MKEAIHACIANALGVSQKEIEELDADFPLKEIGLDSLHFVQLIVILEERLHIEILDSDLLIDHFACRTKIEETLRKYLNE